MTHQLIDPILLGQTIIAELADEYNTLADYHATIVVPPPGCEGAGYRDREQYAVECSANAFKAAAFIVARHTGVKLTWAPSED